MAAPGDRAARHIGLLDRDVGHQPGGCGAVPVVLTGLEEDAVAGADHLDLAALALAEADAFGEPDRLAMRLRVPGGARARCEVDGRSAERGYVARRGDRVDVDRAGEPVARPISGLAV